MPACRSFGRLLVVALWFAAFTNQAGAQDLRQLDQKIYDLLKDVINTGADLYNARADEADPYSREVNRAGCYRIYQGSLLTLQPLLVHRPELVKAIDVGFAKAATQRSMAEKAFTMRGVLDEIRRVVKPGSDEKTLTGPTPAPGSNSTMPGGSSASLWVRLGGDTKVPKIVDDMMAKVRADPKVDFFRKGKLVPTDLEFFNLKSRMTEFISAAANGPKKYSGRTMKSVHKDMGITDAEFTAMLDDMKAVLLANDVKMNDAQELLQILDSTRVDIVDPKSRVELPTDGFRKALEKKDPPK